MIYKILCGIVAAILFVLYLSPVVFKLKDIPLYIVAALGVGMMLLDLWQSLQSRED